MSVFPYRLATFGLGGVVAFLLICLAVVSLRLHGAENTAAKTTQALAGAMANLTMCQVSRRSLDSARAAQNAALDAKAAADAERLAKAEKAVREAGKDREAAQVRAARLLRPVAGADVCARMEAADALILETAR